MAVLGVLDSPSAYPFPSDLQFMSVRFYGKQLNCTRAEVGCAFQIKSDVYFFLTQCSGLMVWFLVLLTP